jgi:hypothetical protein
VFVYFVVLMYFMFAVPVFGYVIASGLWLVVSWRDEMGVSVPKSADLRISCLLEDEGGFETSIASTAALY